MTTKPASLQDLLGELQVRVSAVDELEERVQELEEDAEHAKTGLNEKDAKIEELEEELEKIKLALPRGQIPEPLMEVLRIAYQAAPTRVSYLLNSMSEWRHIESVLGVSHDIARSRMTG